MELRKLVAAAPRRVVRETFGDDPRLEFTVELRLCSPQILDALRDECVKKAKEQQPDRSWAWTEKLNREQLRVALQRDCITGWEGLTAAKAAALCNLDLPEGANGSEPVEFSKDNVLAMLESAVGFADWVWTTVIRTAGALKTEDAAAKNDSGGTPPASSAS